MARPRINSVPPVFIPLATQVTGQKVRQPNRAGSQPGFAALQRAVYTATPHTRIPYRLSITRGRSETRPSRRRLCQHVAAVLVAIITIIITDPSPVSHGHHADQGA